MDFDRIHSLMKDILALEQETTLRLANIEISITDGNYRIGLRPEKETFHTLVMINKTILLEGRWMDEIIHLLENTIEAIKLRNYGHLSEDLLESIRTCKIVSARNTVVKPTDEQLLEIKLLYPEFQNTADEDIKLVPITDPEWLSEGYQHCDKSYVILIEWINIFFIVDGVPVHTDITDDVDETLSILECIATGRI